MPPPPPPPLPQAVLSTLEKAAGTTRGDGALAAIGSQAASIEGSAQTRLAACRREVGKIDRALAGLEPKPGRQTPPAARRERAALRGRRARFETDETQAQTLVAEAGQTFSIVAQRRRDEFSARFLTRTQSPLSPDFWSEVSASGEGDMKRLDAAARNAVNTALEAHEPKALLALGTGLVLLVVLLFPCRLALEAWARRRKLDPDRNKPFTRSAHALWLAAVDTGLPALAGLGLHSAAKWGGLLSAKADALAGAAVIALVWGAAILALGRALATERRVDQRLLDLPALKVGRLKRCLWAVALVCGLGFFLSRLNYVVGASVAATIATNSLRAIGYAAVAGLILLSLRDDVEDDAVGRRPHRSPVWTLISLALTGAIFLIVGAVALGYTTLAALIAGQVFWLSVLAAALFLLLRFVDELCAALFFNQGWAARTLTRLFGLQRATVEQIGVLASASLQLLLILGAASLALTPFGASGDVFLTHFGQMGGPLRIGTATISPVAIATGLVSLLIGLTVVNIVRRWFVDRFLPVTDWDIGLRTSLSTGVTYLGVGLTVLCALGAMGLGFQQIALVASALSVGIGFGLQQVVQNFVSGLILLIERPVKIGDWVHVADVEGDIRRIRVRATEIQLFDRSTVIVPNSDLITKAVQNKTLGDPRGRIQLQVSIANPADAGRARDLIAGLVEADATVLKDPAPAIYIESLASGGGVNFVCFLYLASPRDAYKARSALYFSILEAFQKAGVGFVGAAGPQNLIVEPGPTLEGWLRDRAPKDEARSTGPNPASPT